MHAASRSGERTGDGPVAVNRTEASDLLQAGLRDFRARSFNELSAAVGTTEVCSVLGPTKRRYELEFALTCDDEARSRIVIQATIVDLDWYRFSPLSDRIVVERGD